MTQEDKELKLKLFESIVANADKLCDKGKYMTPLDVAQNTMEVFNYLYR